MMVQRSRRGWLVELTPIVTVILAQVVWYPLDHYPGFAWGEFVPCRAT